MYYFREAGASDDYDKIYALRYQAYCIDNNWLPADNYPDKRETDEYDCCSKHFIAENDNGEMIGCIRLILSEKLKDQKSLPINNHPYVSKNTIKPEKSAEISRLVVEKKVRRGDVSLGLYRMMYQYSRTNQIVYWYILVDGFFLKILNKMGLPFIAIAPPGYYMGNTVPAWANVYDIERNLWEHNEQFLFWFQSNPYILEQKKIIPTFVKKQ